MRTGAVMFDESDRPAIRKARFSLLRRLGGYGILCIGVGAPLLFMTIYLQVKWGWLRKGPALVAASSCLIVLGVVILLLVHSHSGRFGLYENGFRYHRRTIGELMKGVKGFIPFTSVEEVVVVKRRKYVIVFVENGKRITRAVYSDEVGDHVRFQSLLKGKVRLGSSDVDIGDQQFVSR